MRMSGISSSRITSQKALTPLLIFVAISERKFPVPADVIYDSAIHGSGRGAPERTLVLKLLSIKQHSDRCLLSWCE
jgi:hypothetical protein